MRLGSPDTAEEAVLTSGVDEGRFIVESQRCALADLASNHLHGCEQMLTNGHAKSGRSPDNCVSLLVCQHQYPAFMLSDPELDDAELSWPWRL